MVSIKSLSMGLIELYDAYEHDEYAYADVYDNANDFYENDG